MDWKPSINESVENFVKQFLDPAKLGAGMEP